ncbi:MAG: hypothetical protein WBX25_28085 [Rhodomicrobium sp.]
MTTNSRRLRSDDPLAVELTAALKQGEVERVNWLLAADPELARCMVENPKGGGRSLMHLFAIGPGTIRTLLRSCGRLLRPELISTLRPPECGTARRRSIGRPATMTSR